MSDEALRALEREWEAAPHDQAALARVLAERRRRGLPIPRAQRRAEVHGPLRLELHPLHPPRLVRAEPDGRWAQQFGPDVPAHRLVVMQLPSLLDRVPDPERAVLAQLVAKDGGAGVIAALTPGLAEDLGGLPGLRLLDVVSGAKHLPALTPARGLEALRVDLPGEPLALAGLTALPALAALALHGRPPARAELEAVAAIPALDELSLAEVAPDRGADLEALRAARGLACLRLGGGTWPEHLRAISGVAALRELELCDCHHLRPDDLAALAPLRLERLVLSACLRLGDDAAARARALWPAAAVEVHPAPGAPRLDLHRRAVHGCARCRRAPVSREPDMHSLVVRCSACGLTYDDGCLCDRCLSYGSQGRDEVVL